MAFQRYVSECAMACYNSGLCQLEENEQILHIAQSVLNESRKKTMSLALWCDEGNHAFSSRDTGRRELRLIGYDNDGNESTEERLACSQHLPQMRPTSYQTPIPPMQPIEEEVHHDMTPGPVQRARPYA